MPGDAGEDAELVVATARGDDEAFALLVRRHIRAATLLAAQLLGDQDDAEDIVQVSFTLVHDRAGTFDASRPFKPWLYSIVRRLASNRRARDARRARLMQLWGRWSGGIAAPSDNRADGGVEAREDAEAVRREMELLSPMQRACFELVALRGISTEEAAAMHGISESTVRQHVFRARQALSRALEGISH